MLWSAFLQIFNVLFQFITLCLQSDHAKEVEILLLRRQLAILQRQNKQVVRPQREDKFVLAILAYHLKTISKHTTAQLQSFVSIVRPETVLRWHREIVRRKWTFNTTPARGRPAIEVEVETLIIRLARENDWDYGKIIGELRKLGLHIRKQSVANILKQNGIPPLPERQPSLSWQHLMTHYTDQLLACDFFTVESLFLQTIYIFFFIEMGRRTVHFAGCTTSPNKAWITQQARHLIWKLDEHDQNMRVLIHDRDKKFTHAFDAVFVSEHIDIILTPYQAPNANAFAERWVRSVREECLDKLIILNQTHLQQVMHEYVDDYNTARPHRGIGQQIPVSTSSKSAGRICCRDVLGGIIHDYYRDIA